MREKHTLYDWKMKRVILDEALKNISDICQCHYGGQIGAWTKNRAVTVAAGNLPLSTTSSL